MRFRYIIIFGASLIIFSSCKKYLDLKPDKAMAVPSTIKDLQALLDNTERMNENNPAWGLACIDDYYLPQDIYTNEMGFQEKLAYTWDRLQYASYPNDWAFIYNHVYLANVILEGIETVQKTASNQVDWDNVKGSALVFRSQAFLRAIFLFSKAYDESSAKQEYGIVLRLSSNFNEKSVRSSQQESYDRILDDLKEAANLLPDRPFHVMRPSKNAAYALLARAYLSMRKYDSAFKYADLSIKVNGNLLDYNDFNPNSSFPFKRFNSEVIFHSIIGPFSFSNAYPPYAKVDTTLYQSYMPDDLRKVLFFRLRIAPSTYSFKGLYNGDYNLFVGIANDEVFLMRAECNARNGNVDSAMSDLNYLMVRRWKQGTFVPFTASSKEEALAIILAERRKELIFRDLRWMDLKRLNKEGANIILRRFVNNQEYVLLPNANKYALALPADIVNMTGIPQNVY